MFMSENDNRPVEPIIQLTIPRLALPPSPKGFSPRHGMGGRKYNLADVAMRRQLIIQCLWRKMSIRAIAHDLRVAGFEISHGQVWNDIQYLRKNGWRIPDLNNTTYGRPKIERRCRMCGLGPLSRKDARYCSAHCRLAAWRARTKILEALARI